MSKPYVYINECPACKDAIEFPFQRNSGPVAYIHHRRGGQNRTHGRACRLIVHPDPERQNHKVTVVPSTLSLENAIALAVGSWVDGLCSTGAAS